MTEAKKAFEAFYRTDAVKDLIQQDLFTCLAKDAFLAGAAWQRERDIAIAERWDKDDKYPNDLAAALRTYGEDERDG